MYAAGERILVRPLKVDLDELIVFQYRYFRLMAIGPNHQLLTHDSPPFWADDESSAISGFALRLQPAYPADPAETSSRE
jgi:hypothetical protein